LLAALLVVASAEPMTEQGSGGGDVERLEAAGLPTDGPALIEFLRQRTRLDVDVASLTALADDLGNPDLHVSRKAMAALVGHGPAALPVLRRVVNELGEPQRGARARRCVQLLEGTGADLLPVSVVRVLGQRRPPGAAEALLAYLPAADSESVVEEVSRALSLMAFVDRKPQPALLDALKDRSPLRRAVACSVLARPDQPSQDDKLRPLLKDPQPQVRLRAALALVNAHDPEAVPVLIDLIGVLPSPEWQQAEDVLRQLAGPWAPATEIKGEDEIARRIRREVWAVWWKHTEGPALLAEIRGRTLLPADQTRANALIEKMSDEDFAVRQRAADDLVAMGTRVIPVLKPVTRHTDPERARRAVECMRRITEEARPLPPSALRLLGLRKPDGALAALLDYLPYAEDESLVTEVRNVLPILGVRAGEPDALLLRTLEDKNPQRRLIAGEALLKGGGEPAWPMVRKLLLDANQEVRLRIALALVAARDKVAILTLIDSLADEPSELQGQALEVLERLAGDKVPEVEPPTDAAGRKKMRDAWAAWWHDAENTVSLTGPPPLLGYTLLVEVGGKGNNGRVQEIGRDGKPRWVIEGLKEPKDAHIVPGNHVLIAEMEAKRVSERDFKGTIIWQKVMPHAVINCQRLPGGNTFVAMDSGFAELDRKGQVIWQLPYPRVDAGFKGADGIINILTRDNNVVRIMPNGQEVKSFPCKRKDDEPGGIDVLSNGRVLVSQPSDNSVAEMDLQGHVVWSAPAPGITSATRLATGHTLVSSLDNNKVIELDRSGKVVWEYKSEWGVARARRR
jgi:HEAT repeat protein